MINAIVDLLTVGAVAMGMFLWAVFLGLIFVGGGRVLILPLFRRDMLRHEQRRLAKETRLFAWALIIMSVVMIGATLGGMNRPVEEIFGRGMPFVVLAVLFVAGVLLDRRASRLKAAVDQTTV
jgi:hypothetical protein